MKKTILAVLAGLMLSASVAMAAAPAAPVYSMTATKVKVTDGMKSNPGGRGLVVDGSNVYASTSQCDAKSHCNINITQSPDGGLTWFATRSITEGDFVGNHGMGLAISADKAYAGQKIFHSIWAEADYDGGEYSTYYKYFSTQTGIWSPAVRVNGSIPGVDSWLECQQIAVGSDGQAHVYFYYGGVYYYTTSSAPGSAFTEPVAITAAAMPTAAIEVDASNNVLFVYTTADGAYFIRKPAGSSRWSTATRAMAADATDVGSSRNNLSITSIDANNVYVSHTSKNGFLRVYKTTNAATTSAVGPTWTMKAVTTSTSKKFGGTSIIANKSTKVVTAVTEVADAVSGITLPYEIYRSADGVTWSAATKIGSSGNASLAIDSAGKTLLMFGEIDKSYNFGNYVGSTIFVSKEK